MSWPGPTLIIGPCVTLSVGRFLSNPFGHFSGDQKSPDPVTEAMASITAKVTYALELTKADLRLIGLSLQGLLKRPEDIQAASQLGVRLLKEQLQAVDVQRNSIADALTLAEKEPT